MGLWSYADSVWMNLKIQLIPSWSFCTNESLKLPRELGDVFFGQILSNIERSDRATVFVIYESDIRADLNGQVQWSGNSLLNQCLDLVDFRDQFFVVS